MVGSFFKMFSKLSGNFAAMNTLGTGTAGRVGHAPTCLVILLALATFFVFNSALPTDIMEARNIVTAREMVSDGNWLVPTMNGEPRLEKPPLPTWVAGAIEEVFPGSLSAQRCAAGVMGLLWTLFLFRFVKMVTQRRQYALLTTMVFLTSYHIVVMGRTATWDIYCHAFMMGGIYYLARGLLSDKSEQWRWFPLAGLMMGLSFLSKGPVSFYALLLPALVAIIAFMHPSVKGKWGALAVMLLVCLIVGGWWYAYLLVCQQEAVNAVIHKESASWVNHNVRPWYYYWRFFTETGVWAVLMLAALFVPYWKKVFNQEHSGLKRFYLFSITWTLSALVLLSLMPEKKIRYLLPIMAPCAMCVACLLAHFEDATDLPSRILLKVNGAVVTLAAIAIPVAVFAFKWTSLPVGIMAGALFLSLAFYIGKATRNGDSRKIVYGVCILFMLVEVFLLKPVGRMFGNPQMRSISLTRTMKELKDVPFYHDKGDPVRIEIVYEAGKKILPVDFHKGCAAGGISHCLPFVLISHKYAAQTLPEGIMQDVDTVSLGTFDDNKHPKTDRHYTKDFIYHATVIKSKRVKRK